MEEVELGEIFVQYETLFCCSPAAAALSSRG